MVCWHIFVFFNFDFNQKHEKRLGIISYRWLWIQWGPPKKKENTIADNIISCDGIGGLFRAIKLSTGRAHLTCSWSYWWKGLQWMSIILSRTQMPEDLLLFYYHITTRHITWATPICLPPSLFSPSP
jgi:hypothetical protein